MDAPNSTLVKAKFYHVMSSIQLNFSIPVRSVLPRNINRQAGGLLNSHDSMAFSRIRFVCHSPKAVAKVF